MLFLGIEQDVPDATTLCRFRNLLKENKVWEKLLRIINLHIEFQGLKVEASHGAIIDAIIINSAARPRKTLEGIVEDRNEEEDTKSVSVAIQGEVQASLDLDVW